MRRARFLHEGDAVEARHLEIRQDDVGHEFGHLTEALEAIGRGLGDITFVA